MGFELRTDGRPAAHADVGVPVFGEEPAIAAGEGAEVEGDVVRRVLRETGAVGFECDGTVKDRHIQGAAADAMGAVGRDKYGGGGARSITEADDHPSAVTIDRGDGAAVDEGGTCCDGLAGEKGIEVAAPGHDGKGLGIGVSEAGVALIGDTEAIDDALTHGMKTERETSSRSDEDAAAAGLAARKAFAVDEENTNAVLGEMESSGGATGPGT